MRAVIAGLPHGPGVYRFRDARGRVLYLGRAVDLRRRVGSYWTDLGDRRHLARMVPQIVGIEAVPCDSAHEAAWLERNLLERSKPRWNRIRGGAEVPVYVRLDAARLAVVHEPHAGSGELFGPYLGGTRARLAVSGLDRVLPLGYADERLSGTRLDLARVRGVAVSDRQALLATIVAVLQREPGAVDAVKGLLVRQRDRASGGLAFELAARIQQELEAIDWIVAEQKVTVTVPCAADDCDVYGWAGGVLVHFEIRGGRLCAWRQRACSPATARRYLDQTPGGWQAFASRSAQLAQRLSSAEVGATASILDHDPRSPLVDGGFSPRDSM